MYTCTRVAILYVAPDYVFASWEYTVLRVGIEANQLIFVYVGEVYREVTEDKVYLFKRQFARCHFEFLVRLRCICCIAVLG